MAKDLKGQLHLTVSLARFCDEHGHQTIMLMATSFGIKKSSCPAQGSLWPLLVQFGHGAFFVAWLSGKIGNVKPSAGASCLVRRVRVRTGFKHQRVLRDTARHRLAHGRHRKPPPLDLQQAFPRQRTTPRTSVSTKSWRKVGS